MTGWVKLILISGVLIAGFGVSFAIAFAVKYTEDKDLCEVDELDEISNSTKENE